jgi:hypothetical protein
MEDGSMFFGSRVVNNLDEIKDRGGMISFLR